MFLCVLKWESLKNTHPNRSFVYLSISFLVGCYPFPLFTLLLLLENWKSSRWPVSVVLKLMAFFQYKISPSASFHWCTCFPITLTVVPYLLEAEGFVTCRQREAPSRCLPAAGPSSPPGLAYKGSLSSGFSVALQSLKAELCGENRHKFHIWIASRVFQRGAGVHLEPDLRRYRIVSISVGLGLSILCLKWLPKRERAWCSITLECDERVVSKNGNFEHWDVPLTFS